MSLHSFKAAMTLKVKDTPFSALIMAAMAKADDKNLPRLRDAWPDMWDELQERYWAPGGLIGGEETVNAEPQACKSCCSDCGRSLENERAPDGRCWPCERRRLRK